MKTQKIHYNFIASNDANTIHSLKPFVQLPGIHFMNLTHNLIAIHPETTTHSPDTNSLEKQFVTLTATHIINFLATPIHSFIVKIPSPIMDSITKVPRPILHPLPLLCHPERPENPQLLHDSARGHSCEFYRDSQHETIPRNTNNLPKNPSTHHSRKPTILIS